ncbi:MAG: hypothetical protein CSA76_04070 [Spirochaetales bacterium]|nr:MAG: hypothetical protein CSA76_04070 [Spirochaetales bacterium]
MKTIKLSNGYNIPAIGLGTWQSMENEAEKAVLAALETGYRHIDTAAFYDNEQEVGKAVRESGIPREDLFLTTKIWNSVSTAEEADKAIDQSLQRLGCGYIDLLLLHWPGSCSRNAAVYSAMEKAVDAGKVRSLGVSNHNIHHIDALLKTAGIAPVVNQVECHIHLQNHRLQAWCAEKGIILEAYAPLKSWRVKDVLEDSGLQKVAEKHGKTPVQIALRWFIQRGIVPLPKSVNPQRIASNFDVFNFSLTDEDMKVLRSRNKGQKLFMEPDNIDFGFPALE